MSNQKKQTYSNPVVNPRSSEFEVNNWIVSEFIVKELVPVVGWLPFPLTELTLMTSAVIRLEPTHIFEWGTHIGKSARIFYEVTKTFKIPAKIYSIDLPDEEQHNEHPHEQRGMLVKGKTRVELIQGDGLKDSLRIIKKLPKSARILFFIDGDHSYESVKREFGGLIKVCPNAAFLLHDTFYQSPDSKYNTGPFKATQEILANRKGYKTISTNTGLPGMTLVYKQK